ncbi:flocculation protein FLO11-like [Lactuca sativa]|uniref:flocculation protein FLO11-like n=1 Tax=Lactuca sativa TaxID=4236 RepID=UPI0022B00835|nr:flocculation protein FLO11-like [Lactuca sativa]
MYGDVPADSRIIRTYKEFRRSGPRELTPEMLKSIHDADKPAPRGKKADKGKEKQVAKGVKGPSPKKRKTTKTVQSPPQKRRKTQLRRKMVIASSSSESEEESSASKGSPRGNTPPRSPIPEVHFSTSPISSPPVTIPVSIPPITSTTAIPSTSIPVPPPIFTEEITTTTEIKMSSKKESNSSNNIPPSLPSSRFDPVMFQLAVSAAVMAAMTILNPNKSIGPGYNPYPQNHENVQAHQNENDKSKKRKGQSSQGPSKRHGTVAVQAVTTPVVMSTVQAAATPVAVPIAQAPTMSQLEILCQVISTPK